MSDFRDIRLSVADLDGTLLDDHKELDAGIFEVIRKLQERHIMFTLASGRNVHIMKPYLKQLSLRLPFIANNGANMFKEEACIYEKSMEPKELEFVFQVLEKQNIPCIAYTRDIVFTTSLQDTRLQLFLERLRGKTMIQQAAGREDMLGHAIFKVVMIAKDSDKMEAVLHRINLHCKALHAVRSEDDVYTITHVDATKGKTLIRLMEELHVSAKQTLVFGDNFNDATMFAAAGISVCMENGQQKVKEKADYIAKANTAQGVSRFLKEHILSDIEGRYQ